MPLLRVRRTPDRVWRCELWSDGWRVLQHGGLRLSQTTEQQVKVFLAREGVDWDGLVDD